MSETYTEVLLGPGSCTSRNGPGRNDEKSQEGMSLHRTSEIRLRQALELPQQILFKADLEKMLSGCGSWKSPITRQDFDWSGIPTRDTARAGRVGRGYMDCNRPISSHEPVSYLTDECASSTIAAVGLSVMNGSNRARALRLRRPDPKNGVRLQ